MLFAEFPILEFDTAREAVLEPSRVIAPQDVPEHCVLCFFHDVINLLREKHDATEVAHLGSEAGTVVMDELRLNGRRLGVLHPGVGAPLAGGLLEEAIALGSRKFMACGGAGVLDSRIGVGDVLIPTHAVRDEGTSYHYLPPTREVEAHPAAVEALRSVCEEEGVVYRLVKTWTTDAFYRETPAKVVQRRDEGCSTVEMEAAAFFAIAHFRGVPLGQLLYGGDDVGGAEWDGRNWNRHSIRERLFWLAAKACLKL